MTTDNKENGIDDEHKVKRSYTMSDKALEARRNNAQKSTGPTTEEGKQTSSRNAWKHGIYARTFLLGKLGKPCLTTCDKYPCDLVTDNAVEPGQTCLEKQHVAETFDAIINKIQDKGHEAFTHIAALEMAGAIQILREAKEAILADGIILKTVKVDSNGDAIGTEYKPHPAWSIYTKMLTDLGITPQDFVMTPREIAKAEKGLDPEEVENAASIMTKAVANLAKIGREKGKE